MSANVMVVDYGLGNLHSVVNAIRKLGHTAVVADEGLQLAEADRLILPGVGAFGDGMRELRRRGHDRELGQLTALGVPLLGICLGMQMLFESSDEHGFHSGLSLIPGSVHRLDQNIMKVPHVGWRRLHPSQDWQGSFLEETPEGTFTYFTHSFEAKPKNADALLAFVESGEHKITAAVRCGNIFGAQFHPEKSGDMGLAILDTFCNFS